MKPETTNYGVDSMLPPKAGKKQIPGTVQFQVKVEVEDE
jgi:hypothetical protein